MLGNLFTCFPVPASAASAIQAASGALRLPDGWRTVDPTEWHLTLVFLGPHDPEPFRELLTGLSVASEPLTFTGWSFFPHPGRARVLALSGPTPPSLTPLLADLTARAERTGWTPRFAKPFVLHCTVARGPVGPAFDVPAFEPITLTPESVTLLETESINPATYRTLASVPCASTSSASPSTT